MKTIKGICIKNRNFDKFKKVADLIYFDGPLLSHYVTNKGDNYLFYWIDQDDTNNRWMFIRTDYDNIQKYTNKKQTLRNVLSSPLDDIVYTVDIDEEGNHHNFQAHSIEDLPEDYLPTEDSYYEFEPEDVNKENLSIAEMSGKKLDWFRKVCASVHFIPPRLYASYATCSHCTIPTNRLPQRRDSPLFPLPDNMFQMEFFLILLDEETY